MGQFTIGEVVLWKIGGELSCVCVVHGRVGLG